MSTFSLIKRAEYTDSSVSQTRVLQLLGQKAGLSAADISRQAGLSKSNAARIVEHLKQVNLISEVPQEAKERTRRGRPGSLLSLNPNLGTCVGLVLQPDGIELTVADTSHRVHVEHRVDLEQDYSVELGINAASRLVDAVYHDAGLDRSRLLGVGVAVPGPVEPRTGRVLRSSMVPIWAGTDISGVFSAALGAPVFVDNESNCAALAEMTWGAARNDSEFVYFKLDIGVGGAIVINGNLVVGVAGGAGEVGHMTINPDGPLCRCGNRGCIELYAGWNAVIEPARLRFGESVRFEDIAAEALKGDPGCRRLIEDAAATAGRGLANICAVLNPPLVVVGGRQLAAGDILMKAVVRGFNEYFLIKQDAVSDESRTRIVPGMFVDNRGTALGAFSLVMRNLFPRILAAVE